MAIERRGSAIASLLEGIDEPLVSAVCVAELVAGAREAFLSDVLQAMPVLPFGEREAWVHAELFVALRRAGLPIGERDLLIAATAMADGHGVMTHNSREFRRIDGLQVIELPNRGT